MEKEIIDCLDFGDIFEMNPHGDLDTTDNIESLFAHLTEEGKYDLPPRTKIKVWGSNVNWSSKENPFRYSFEMVRTLGHLKRYYLSWSHIIEEFNIEKYYDGQEWKMALLEKEGERRTAFGLMRMIGDYNRATQLEEDHKKDLKEAYGDKKKIEKIEKDFKNRTSNQMMIIG
ncbi:hypothetical protein GW765_04325 [Candidatus Parcubacteria bacterium]|nr:hypothetical protein [Candidatus Parcubacteria bacterium]